MLTTIVTENIYHTQEQLQSELTELASAFPSIAQLFTIGQSEQGRDLFGLRISDNVGVEEDEPEVKFAGPVHGDEPVGQAALLYWADELLHGYGVDPRLTEIVDETDIVILPQLNPDGYRLGRRTNINFIDLNRNYPEGSAPNDIGTIYDGDPLLDAGRQAETRAVMQFSAGESFALSLNMHGGALVANYPYDSDGMGSVYSATPDDDLFKELALAYSTPNTPMYSSNVFPQGITNGADWYEVKGGMQDWNYRYLSDFEITIEISNTKKPPSTTLTNYYDDNRESLTAYAEFVHKGLRGLVTDAATGDELYAKVSVIGGSYGTGQPVYTDPDVGDYHRLLLPGTYDLLIESEGYEPQTITGVSVAGGPTTRLDVALQAIDTTPPTVLASDFDIDAPLPTVTMQFSEPVSFNPDRLLIQNVDTGSYHHDAKAGFDWIDSQTIGFYVDARVLPNGNYEARLFGSLIFDAAGNAMTTNPVEPFFILAGDANRDRVVDLADFVLLRNNFAAGSLFSEGDFNFDDQIDLEDFVVLRNNFGQSVPSLLPGDGDDDDDRSFFG